MAKSEWRPVSFGTGSNRGRTGQESLTEQVNAYIETLGEEAKTSFSAYAINGTTHLVSLGNDTTEPVRKLFTLDSTVLALCGRLLYSTTEAGGAPITIGGIPSDGFATFARNRQTPNAQVAIVCDGQVFVYQAGTLSPLADPDLPPPVCVVEINGYLAFLIADGRYFITSVDDITVDALGFASAESNADANVMGARRGKDLIIFGTKTTQFMQDTGAADFPLTNVTTIDVGCYAAGSVANIMRLRPGVAATDTVIWAATDNEGAFSSICILDGYNAVPISTDEVNRLVRDEPDPASIRSMAWTEDGHAFYCITGTSFSRVWDTKTEKWHNRESHGLNRWRMGTHATAGRSCLFGDNTSNKIYVSRADLMTENGAPIVFTIITPPIHMSPYRMKLNGVALDLFTGVGINSSNESDADPMVMVDYTRDGGISWGALRTRPLGKTAQRQVGVTLRGYGNFDRNGVTFRIRCSASVMKGLMAMHVSPKELRAA